MRTEKVCDLLKSIVGEQYLYADPEKMYNYAKDFTVAGLRMPCAVVIPNTVEEVSAIAKICNDNKVSLTVRGGGTGVSGGSLTYDNGIILSLERLNRILSINKIDRIVIAEAGVITQSLQQAVLQEGLCFPQNISSSASCFIGGNAAVSSGSPKSLKYGPTKNYILNMEVVLPDGTVMWTGKNVHKDASGYNLTQLFAGSEGTLGIITKVVLRLVNSVEEALLMVPFQDIDKLFDSVHQLLRQGISPSGIEFIDAMGYEIVSGFLKRTLPASNPVAGVLWVELEGKDNGQLMEEMAAASEVIACFTSNDIFAAQTGTEMVNLWGMRARIGEAVIHSFHFRDIDIVVPCSKIHEMQAAVEKITGEYHFKYTAFGHIGNGNFHVNLLQPDGLAEEEWLEKSGEGIAEIFTAAVRLGGTISGEHGIGKIQRPYLPLTIPEYQLNFMKAIKALFDPHGIFNPGNIF